MISRSISAEVPHQPPAAVIVPPDEAVSPPPSKIPHYEIRVVRAYPHDPQAFTQGLSYAGGFLYESTGLYGSSSLRKVDLTTGRVIRIHRLPPEYFGEGITFSRGRIIQLTWQERRGFVYDPETFRILNSFSFAGEGWGIAWDGRCLIISDGTARLRFLDPDTYREVKSITVKDQGRSVSLINELEYVNGEVFANIWKSDLIARISPSTGEVVGWINLQGIYQGEAEDMLNGIAYDEQGGRLFITGKHWPYVYEVQISPPGDSSLKGNGCLGSFKMTSRAPSRW